MENKNNSDYAEKLITPEGKSIHLKPLNKISGYEVRPGFYEINGASAIPCGVNFTVHSHMADSCELLLFHRGEKEPYAILKYPDNYKIGNVYSMIVFGLNIYDFEYAYRLNGPYCPEEGLIFDKTRYLLDPYAKAVTGQSSWGRKQEDFYKARVVQNDFDWSGNKQSDTQMQDLIIYELHVRGFTNHTSSGVKNPGTFAGIIEKVPYLRELGINAVELMPIFEFDELQFKREWNGKELIDYWGYNPVCFFAPNTSYTANLEYNREGSELKELVKTCHDNEIEVILDVVFNHTAEGNEKGPYFSFKGFDNNIYYMLTPEGQYYNFSGCGNTLNCNHPIVQQMILECLRYWTITYRVDGFRFDLASILGRDEEGAPLSKPPLLQSLAFDPILGNVKLIAEAWDAGGMYQVGSFPSWSRWAEWNGKYRDDMRSFLKGDYWMAARAAECITGSLDLYDPKSRGENVSVNFLTCHDGFTLYDLYSYQQKHNEDNGWNNTDGTDDNRSWNCGAEGETDDPEILRLRMRMIKNACVVLMCSRGTPMFLAGDEFGNTQFGNNNPYCQDNIISWLDWDLLKKNTELHQFFRFMIHFRKGHAAIRKNLLQSACGFPFFSVHGSTPWQFEKDQETKVICVMFAGRESEKRKDDIVYLAINVYWEEQQIWLPKLPNGMEWRLSVDTFRENAEECMINQFSRMKTAEKSFMAAPRSVAVFVAG